MESSSTVVTVSSAAALRGSPLSGGYAEAKAAIRSFTSNAAAESRREGLGIRFVAVLPHLTPATRLREAWAAAYAAREGVEMATFLEKLGPVLTSEQVGTDVVDLVGGSDRDAGAYLLTAAGLKCRALTRKTRRNKNRAGAG